MVEYKRLLLNCFIDHVVLVWEHHMEYDVSHLMQYSVKEALSILDNFIPL